MDRTRRTGKESLGLRSFPVEATAWVFRLSCLAVEGFRATYLWEKSQGTLMKPKTCQSGFEFDKAALNRTLRVLEVLHKGAKAGGGFEDERTWYVACKLCAFIGLSCTNLLGSFRKLGVPPFGVLIIRILPCRVPYLGPLFWETPTSKLVAKPPAVRTPARRPMRSSSPRCRCGLSPCFLVRQPRPSQKRIEGVHHWSA